MKPPIVIRQPTPEEADAIQKVARSSWEYTYGAIFTDEKIQNFINQVYNPQLLKKQIFQLPSTLFSFLVVFDKRAERLAGFGQIGYEGYWEIDEASSPQAMINQQKHTQDIQLFRIYLDPDYIGKGLGKKMLTHLEDFVISEQRSSYGVYVHEANQIGIRFYEKMGFKRDPTKDKDDEWYYNRHLK